MANLFLLFIRQVENGRSYAAYLLYVFLFFVVEKLSFQEKSYTAEVP